MNAIVEHVRAQITPNAKLGLSHQGNWPAWATFAVEYALTHTKGGVEYPGPTNHAYFSDFTEYVEWADTRRSWVNQTPSLSFEIRLYEWDLGPTCKDYYTI